MASSLASAKEGNSRLQTLIMQTGVEELDIRVLPVRAGLNVGDIDSFLRAPIRQHCGGKAESFSARSPRSAAVHSRTWAVVSA